MTSLQFPLGSFTPPKSNPIKPCSLGRRKHIARNTAKKKGGGCGRSEEKNKTVGVLDKRSLTTHSSVEVNKPITLSGIIFYCKDFCIHGFFIFQKLTMIILSAYYYIFRLSFNGKLFY